MGVERQGNVVIDFYSDPSHTSNWQKKRRYWIVTPFHCFLFQFCTTNKDLEWIELGIKPHFPRLVMMDVISLILPA
jgi:hypothetical protein